MLNALDDRARGELRRYRRRSLIWLAAGCALFVIFGVSAVIVDNRAQALERTGARVAGIATSVRGLGEQGSLVVKFSWAGTAHAGVVHLDAESPNYREGQRVTVILDRSNPGRFTIRGETNQSPVTTLPMVGAFVGSASMLVLSAFSLTRVRRQRRCLVLHPWIQVSCIYREIPAGSSVRPLLLLRSTEHQSVVMTLASIARWRLGKTGLRVASEIDVSGDPSAYVVVRAPRSDALVSARPPRTARAERRWRRALETIAIPPGPTSR